MACPGAVTGLRDALGLSATCPCVVLSVPENGSQLHPLLPASLVSPTFLRAALLRLRRWLACVLFSFAYLGFWQVCASLHELVGYLH